MVYNKDMQITKPFPGTDIILLKEFSTKEEAKLVNDYLSSMYYAAKEKDDSLKREDLREEFNSIMTSLDKKYRETATEILDFVVEPKFSTLHNYVYWEPGQRMLPHYDNLGGDHSAPVMYGCVYYINDDFKGGELWYPNQGVEYVPEAGDLIMHPGSREYSHGVREIESGLRISAGSFITQKDQSDDEFDFEY